MNSTTSPHERAPLLPPTKFLHRRYSRPEPGEWHDSPVRTSIHNLRTYITVSITPATDRTLITPRDSSVITDQFIEDACAVCEDRNSLPYCALRCMEKFQRQSELYPQWSDVFDVRALAAELLARRLEVIVDWLR
ncbi:hypothetical protein BC936DRAFT_137132 [Jimgerdemannia flammicorona]|uniref:YVC1 N-terminal linker helical domain-containing protein n=1 Tax=Jimgerdemannia flammicorona TaxID=994334 RepID=A0A433CY06_9FUNG|nr:hypothetical protein BC936DRAFT_137132 [Jimgerdemannia flammicorona]